MSRRVTDEAIEQARQMRAAGMGWRQIAADLGIAHSTARTLVLGPDGVQASKRARLGKDELPPRVAEAVQLRNDGATRQQIAQRMGIQPATVDVFMREARRRGAVAGESTGNAEMRPVRVIGVCPVKRCGTRIFDDGRGHVCVPDVVAFMGRRGEQNCGTDTGRRR
jgi:DNA-binding CsgD family transcriptional regulator